MPAVAVPRKRLPGTLAERFWSLAHSASPLGGTVDIATDPEPKAVVRHVLQILDSLAAGEVGDGVSHSSVSFLALLRQHEAMGDLSYASPEQARGESIDERSLVFSVGVLLFEELTGRHPFGRETARRFARIKKGELGSGVQYFPQVPTELRSVLVQAMGPFPEERFASLAELRGVLEGFVAAPLQRPADDSGDNDRTRHFRRPVMFVPGISLPADAFSPPPPAHHLATPPATNVPPPLPMSRPIASPLMSTPLLPPVRRQKRGRVWAVADRAGWLLLGGLATVAVLKLPSLLHRAPVAVVALAPAAPVSAPSILEPPAPAQVVVEPPAPAVFDANAAAAAGAVAARKCWGPLNHTVAFGAGLLFAADDAQVHRAFLSPDDPLSPEARRCVAKALVGVSAGAPPSERVIVEVRYKLKPDGSDDIKVK